MNIGFTHLWLVVIYHHLTNLLQANQCTKKKVGTIEQTTLMKNTKLIHGMKKYIINIESKHEKQKKY
jgi:hypothetical protein